MEEANIGKRGETLVVRLINDDKEFAGLFTCCLQRRLGLPVCDPLRARKAPAGLKTDVTISGSDGAEFGLSLKTMKPGRPDDHLDRRWLDKSGRLSRSWKETLDMPYDVFNAFRKGIARKARDRNAELICPEDQPLVKKFLMSRLDTFLEESFRRGEADLRLFAIIQYEENEALYVFRMGDIISLVKKDILISGLRFSKVISLGNFLWIQRKAGDGKHVDERIPKSDTRHPGNQLQVKILPIRLKDEAVRKLDYCEFEIPPSFGENRKEA